MAQRLDSLLLENDGKPARERSTLIRVFEELRERDGERLCGAVVAPGVAYQFDWSHDVVVIDGVTTTVKSRTFAFATAA